MLGLVIVHDETGVNDAGHPAEKGKEQAQEETQNAAGHQDGDWRQDNAEKVAKSFQRRMMAKM
jgi:hypothetical protein